MPFFVTENIVRLQWSKEKIFHFTYQKFLYKKRIQFNINYILFKHRFCRVQKKDFSSSLFSYSVCRKLLECLNCEYIELISFETQKDVYWKRDREIHFLYKSVIVANVFLLCTHVTHWVHSILLLSFSQVLCKYVHRNFHFFLIELKIIFIFFDPHILWFHLNKYF